MIKCRPGWTGSQYRIKVVHHPGEDLHPIPRSKTSLVLQNYPLENIEKAPFRNLLLQSPNVRPPFYPMTQLSTKFTVAILCKHT